MAGSRTVYGKISGKLDEPRLPVVGYRIADHNPQGSRMGFANNNNLLRDSMNGRPGV